MNSDAKAILRGLIIGGGLAVLLITGIFAARFFLPPQTQPPAAPIPPTATDSPPVVFIAPVVPTLPPASPTPDPAAELSARILASLPEYGGAWEILIREDGSRKVFAYHADNRDHIASIIKIPIAMLFFKALEANGIPPAAYADYLSSNGAGRTYAQLLRAMLVESEEQATGLVRDFVTDASLDTRATLNAWGAVHTDISTRFSTPEDIATLYERLYFGDAIPPEGRALILDCLSAYTPNDETRLGQLRLFLPAGGKFYNKRGSVVAGRLIIGDSALLTWKQNGAEKVYVIVALAYNGESPTTDVKLERGIQNLANLFWDYAVKANEQP